MRSTLLHGLQKPSSSCAPSMPCTRGGAQLCRPQISMAHQAGSGEPAQGGFSSQLWQQHKAVAYESLHSPFVTALGNGTLARQELQGWASPVCACPTSPVLPCMLILAPSILLFVQRGVSALHRPRCHLSHRIWKGLHSGTGKMPPCSHAWPQPSNI